MKSTAASPFLFACSFLLLTLYLLIEIIFTPIVQADVLNGFLSLNNALSDKGVNFQYYLDPAGIIHKEFYTWHAPGQYFFPYILGLPFNNIGYGIILTEFISLAAGSVVYVQFFRKLKVPDDVIGLSLLFIFLQRFFHGVLLVYKTSDICMFFLVPALLLLLFAYHKEKPSAARAFLYLLAIFFVNGLGLFIKNSYVVFTAFAHLFFFSSEMYELVRSRSVNLKKAAYQLLPGLVLCAVVAIFYWGFYSRGVTPARTGIVHQDPLLYAANMLFYPVITVFGAPFSFNGLMYRLPMLTTGDLGNASFSWRALAAGLGLVLPVVFVFYRIWKTSQLPPFWKQVTFSALAFYCFTWGYFVFAASDISNEDRLIFPAVMIVTPALAYVLLRTKFMRYIVAGCVAVSLLFSVAALYALKNYHQVGMAVNRTDIFNHFSVSDKNQYGNELATLNTTLAHSSKNALLIMETTEDFFRTGLVMPAVASYHDHHQQVEEIAHKNVALFRAEGYKHVYFVVPAETAGLQISRNMHVVNTDMKHFSLLRFDL